MGRRGRTPPDKQLGLGLETVLVSDGQRIAFQSSRAGNYEIYVMASDGSNPHRLTDHPADDWFPSWSPDGRHIDYGSGRAGNYAIYVMGPDGSNPRNLTNDSYRHYYPSCSPDDRMAFMTVRYNKAAIYVMDSDGSNRRFLTIDLGSALVSVLVSGWPAYIAFHARARWHLR